MPIHATVSAINWPFTISGSACRLMNDGARKCTRSGFGEPSLAIKQPSSPRGDSTVDKRFARRRRKSFRENLEMVDERFHLRLHFLALRRNDARCFGLDRAVIGDLVHGLADDFQALAHFRDAHQIPRITIGFRARRHVEIKFFVRGIREGLAVVVSHAGRAKPWARLCSERSALGGKITDALQPPLPDAIFRQQCFIFVDPRAASCPEIA